MEFRIGIHLGEVRVLDGRLFGNGVDIAARLEALAEPGGVCISAKVHEEVTRRTPFSFRDIGGQRVKSIPERVHAYAVETPAQVAASGPPAGRRRWPIGAALVVLMVLVGAVGWWMERLEPLSPFMAVNLATIHGAVRDYENSARAARHAIALEPQNPFGHFLLAGALWTAGDAEGSFDALLGAPLPQEIRGVLREAYAAAGIDGAWARLLDLVIAETGDPRGGVNGPGLHAMAGHREIALSCIERAVDIPGLYMNLYLKLHPLFDPLRSEPRFQAALAQMNLGD